MLEVLENLLWWLVLIGVMIMIHELGHFMAARYFDVKVEAFSFGFGPRLFGFRRGDTDYRVSLILFGGYVKMAGEQFQEVGTAGPETDNNGISNRYESTINDPRSLLAKPRWQRLIIAFAGPFMNIVLAVGLLTGLYMVKYQKVSDADMEAVIGHVMPDSPAAKAGIQDGDRIVRLEARRIPPGKTVEMKEIASAYRPMHLTIERNGKRFDTTVTPVLNERYGCGICRLGCARLSATGGCGTVVSGGEGRHEEGRRDCRRQRPADPFADQVPGTDQEQRRQARSRWIFSGPAQLHTVNDPAGVGEAGWSAALDDRRGSAAEAGHHHHQAVVPGCAERIAAAERQRRADDRAKC